MTTSYYPTARPIRNLSWFLSTDYYQAYRESIYSHIGFSNIERAQRVAQAAIEGLEGSTHAEILMDQKEALQDALRDDFITEEERDDMIDEVMRAWDWHVWNSTIDQQVG